MKAKNSLFALMILVLTIGLSQFFRHFRESYAEDSYEFYRRVQAEKELEREKLRTQLLQLQFLEFQEEVAKSLPQPQKQMLAQNKDYGISKLRSSVRLPASADKLQEDLWLFASAKTDFSNKNYRQASESLEKFLSAYPASPNALEARFLLMESYFQMGRFEECLEMVRLSLSHAPEHPISGYMLLRVGQIMEARRRPDEAKEIYQGIKRQFPGEKRLIEQAQRLLGELR